MNEFQPSMLEEFAAPSQQSRLFAESTGLVEATTPPAPVCPVCTGAHPETDCPHGTAPPLLDGSRCIPAMSADLRRSINHHCEDLLDPEQDSASWVTFRNYAGQIIDDHTLIVRCDNPERLHRLYDHLSGTGHLIAWSAGQSHRFTFRP